ncbi:hypothetical protein [Acinetobacter sp. HY1485]|uniref:hypothetical protein n=1 Tax=Acinetobacter sp. HY1485 TaxID=2970918 RepID=UPI0022B9AC3F|nr:hypothetical protein [Acinetobacter sp. HY1485]
MENKIIFRLAKPSDAPEIYNIVLNTPGIDNNSLYFYTIWLKEFSASNVVATRNDKIVAFLTAFRKPSDSRTLFLWQLAAVPRHGIADLGYKLSEFLIELELKNTKLKCIEATIDIDNQSIFYVLKKITNKYNGKLTKHEFLSQEYLSSNTETHHEETLIKVDIN